MKEKAKVLVVDDQTPMLMTMVAALTSEGFDVTATHNGLKGYDWATEIPFDLIVWDADLPKVNGFDICREMRQRHIGRHASIILVSRNPSIENCQRAFDLGADDFIEKPFDVKDFLSHVLLHPTYA